MVSRAYVDISPRSSVRGVGRRSFFCAKLCQNVPNRQEWGPGGELTRRLVGETDRRRVWPRKREPCRDKKRFRSVVGRSRPGREEVQRRCPTVQKGRKSG